MRLAVTISATNGVPKHLSFDESPSERCAWALVATHWYGLPMLACNALSDYPLGARAVREVGVNVRIDGPDDGPWLCSRHSSYVAAVLCG